MSSIGKHFSIIFVLTMHLLQLAVPVVFGGVFSQMHYKYHGNYVGVFSGYAGSTYTFSEANEYCNATFGTTLATWNNTDDEYDASYARLSTATAPIAGKWSYSGVYSDDNGTYWFIDGSGEAIEDVNTLFSSQYDTSGCTLFDYCAGTIQANSCNLASYSFVCNAPEYIDGKPWSDYNNRTQCQVSLWYSTYPNFTDTPDVGPYDIGYYIYYNCPGFSNDALASAMIESMDGFDCTLRINDGSSNVDTWTLKSGETLKIDEFSSGGISIIEIWYIENETETTMSPTLIPSQAPTTYVDNNVSEAIFSQMHYKYYGNYIGVFSGYANSRYNFSEANQYCSDTFGTTLATWNNTDDEYDASYARLSTATAPIAGKWSYSGVYSDNNGTYWFIDGSGEAIADVNTLFSSQYDTSGCTFFDYCAGTIQANQCGLESWSFVCNAPQYLNGKEWSHYESRTQCQVSLWYSAYPNFTGTADVGPWDIGYYIYYNCPGFTNDKLASAMIEAKDGFDCLLRINDGGGNTETWTVASGETKTVDQFTVGGISIVEIYYVENSEPTMAPTMLPTGAPNDDTDAAYVNNVYHLLHIVIMACGVIFIVLQ